MTFSGVLKKMRTAYQTPVQYFLDLDTDFIHLNQVLEKTLTITFRHFQCLGCGETLPIYRHGHCKSCFFELPQTAEWVIRPELSKAHLDIEDRNLDYEKEVQLQPHVVYLANSGKVKVGVTRQSQIPTRWIDQGAHEALEIVVVPNRYLAGITEVVLKEHISDKTNWRQMLKNQLEDEDLIAKRNQLKAFIPESVKPYFLEHQQETSIEFPVLQYPEKFKSLNLDKQPQFTGKLMGIKGQYLIFDNQMVFNVRNHEGYVVDIQVESKA